MSFLPITATLKLERWAANQLAPGQDVTLPAYSGTETDALGNVVSEFLAAEDWPVYGYGPEQSQEPVTAGANRITSNLVVYAPTAPMFKDRVTVAGQVYEVDGVPGDWNHGPFGFRPGFEVRLRWIDG